VTLIDKLQARDLEMENLKAENEIEGK